MKEQTNNCVADVVRQCTVTAVGVVTADDLRALNVAIAEALEGLALDQEAVNAVLLSRVR
jgi:hypothetical protein